MRTDFIRKVDSAIFGSIFTLWKANKKVEKKISECKPEQFDKDERLGLPLEYLKSELRMSVERLEKIEKKATSTLLGVAVALAVFSATFSLFSANGPLAGYPDVIQRVVAVVLLLAMLYLLSSGLLALSAYKVGQVFRPNMDDRAPLSKAEWEKMVIIFSIDQNQRIGTLRSNRMSASFACLRNGLLSVLLLGVLIVLPHVL